MPRGAGGEELWPGWRCVGRIDKMPLNASAPGKLVLAGEYAVLDGGPAVAAAVGRRAQARLLRPLTQACELQTNGSGHDFRFSLNRRGEPVWEQSPGAQGALLEAALAVAARQQLPITALAPFRLELCSRDLSEAAGTARASKIGIGSSGAVAVAAAAVLQSALGRTPTEAFALEVHRQLQQEQGSGLDVSTSFHGGVIARQKSGEVHALCWPDGLCVLPVWTGIAAATPLMLDKFASFRLQTQLYRLRMQALIGAAQCVLDAWESVNIASLLDAFGAYADELHCFDVASGIGIWSPPHCALERLALDAGLQYKPSGAGGGDLGIALCSDAQALAAFASEARRAGFTPLELDLGVTGLEVSGNGGGGIAPAARLN